MELVAVVEGQVVLYPRDALFVVENRQPKKKYKLKQTFKSFEKALGRFQRTRKENHLTRLRSVCGEISTTLLLRMG